MVCRADSWMVHTKRKFFRGWLRLSGYVVNMILNSAVSEFCSLSYLISNRSQLLVYKSLGIMLTGCIHIYVLLGQNLLMIRHQMKNLLFFKLISSLLSTNNLNYYFMFDQCKEPTEMDEIWLVSNILETKAET